MRNHLLFLCPLLVRGVPLSQLMHLEVTDSPDGGRKKKWSDYITELSTDSEIPTTNQSAPIFHLQEMPVLDVLKALSTQAPSKFSRREILCNVGVIFSYRTASNGSATILCCGLCRQTYHAGAAETMIAFWLSLALGTGLLAFLYFAICKASSLQSICLDLLVGSCCHPHVGWKQVGH